MNEALNREVGIAMNPSRMNGMAGMKPFLYLIPLTSKCLLTICPPKYLDLLALDH